ncbi:WcaI family glycosyltransferase [Chitinophaga alhagiae]|uniref:WcaI family glycosyltransferase n=1 Tax=Chitinophaga alhagiae TaxID=2203219 RepID=UPI000E5A4D85|nr:WcaI family glycosyltransferase [Chitinophaga alhagiae]
MSKRILLIGGNFAPEPTGIGKYNGEMMEWLANKGYECAVITSYPYYPQWKVQEPYSSHKSWYRKEEMNGGRLKVHRCPQYVPSEPSGKKRMMLEASFACSALVKLLQLIPKKRFDVVIVVAPSFHLGLLALLYKKMRKAAFHYHIQDLQIEAARDLDMIRSPRLISMMLRLERYILKGADHVSSISDGMMQKIAGKTAARVKYFPNWVDVERFRPLPDRHQIKAAYGFSPADRIVLYSGAIGEKQGLEAILHAARMMADMPQAKFVICGSGPYREKLQLRAAELDLRQVYFLPLQPAASFNEFLNMADVHLVIQKANASDLVMPSKLTTILSVGGLAVITANPSSTLHQLVTKYQMGMLVEAENANALCEGIRLALEQNTTAIRDNARSYAVDHLSIANVMERFEEQIINAAVC